MLNINMLIKKTISLLFLILFPLSIFSQVSITGRIQDNNGRSVELAEIRLTNLNKTISKSDLTDVNGNFNIRIETGNYDLKIKYK